MENNRLSKNSLTRIQEALSIFSFEWFGKMKSAYQKDPDYNHTSGVIQRVEFLGVDSDGMDHFDRYEVKLPIYTWSGPGTKAVPLLQSASSVIKGIIHLIEEAFVTLTETSVRRAFLNEVFRVLDRELNQLKQEMEDSEYRACLDEVRDTGRLRIERKFIDILDFSGMPNERTLLFNLNQEEVALFMAILEAGGIVQNPQGDIARFSSAHFLCRKNGKNGEYEELIDIRKKINFYTKGYGSQNQLQKLRDKLLNGIDNLGRK